uniref:Uncharacterized protein n=1 Tax=Bacteriophage sp. TaxID=38018 RepID=A0A8D9UHW3_9VIRU|nr:MAG TPA: hypothetical protein [Bacteriophage sp.]
MRHTHILTLSDTPSVRRTSIFIRRYRSYWTS